MELKKIMGFAAMAALAFGATSCSNEEEMTTAMAANQELKVNVGINQQTRAGITATKFTNGESLGLYLYKGSNFDEAYPQVGTHKAKNAHYKEMSGKWAAGVAGQGIVLSSAVGTVYAYYPYAAGNDAVEAGVIPVEVKANQGTGLSDGTKDDTQTDYMWATPVPNVSNSTATVNLAMNHALSMVSFKFQKGDYDGTKDDTQTDYMWATPVPNVSNSTATVNLAMNHALSMVSFKFQKGDYPGEGRITSIQLINAKEVIKTGAATMNLQDGTLNVTGAKGDITITPNAVLAKEGAEYANNEIARMLVYPVATMNLQDGTLNVTGAKGDITITPNAVLAKEGAEYANNEIARMLVYPVATPFAAGDMKVKITLDGKNYTLNVPAPENANTFVAGKNYQYTFKLAGKEFGDNENDITVQVKPWELVEIGGGNLVSPDVE